MIKYIELPEYQPNGEPSVSVITKNLTKTASAKGYDGLPEEMRQFIDSIKPEDDVAYLLIGAATDINWASNNNADAFPTQGISSPGDYGHKTYEKYGFWYHDHVNKDPDKSYGKVVKSVWQEDMGRILLVVKVDLKKDKEVAEAIGVGREIKTSMGCRVSWDCCSVCHPNYEDFYAIEEEDMIKLSKVKSIKEAKEIAKRVGVDINISGIHPDGGVIGIHASPAHYCHHLKAARNRVISTGQRVMLINLRPVFFDISKVPTPADVTSGVLAKVASGKMTLKDDDELEAVLKKISDEQKTGEIVKEIPEGEVLTADEEEIKKYLAYKIYPHLYESEKDIPKEKLDQIAQHSTIPKIIEAFFSLGMMPRPKEFQRMIIISAGNKNLADELWDKDITFDNSEIPAHDFEEKSDELSKSDEFSRVIDGVPDDLIKMLLPFQEERSYLPGHVAQRIVIIKKGMDKGAIGSYSFHENRTPLPTYKGQEELRAQGIKPPGSPIMTILAGLAAYYGAMLTRKMLAKGPIIKVGMNKTKTAGTATSLARLIGIPSAAYIYSGHAYNKAMQGRPLNKFDEFVLKHTMPVALGATALSFRGPRQLLGKGVTSAGQLLKASSIADNIVKCGMDFEGINVDNYNPDLRHPLIVDLWDRLYEAEK